MDVKMQILLPDSQNGIPLLTNNRVETTYESTHKMLKTEKYRIKDESVYDFNKRYIV